MAGDREQAVRVEPLPLVNVAPGAGLAPEGTSYGHAVVLTPEDADAGRQSPTAEAILAEALHPAAVPESGHHARAGGIMGRMATAYATLGVRFENALGGATKGVAAGLSKVNPKLASAAPILVTGLGIFGASKLGNMDLGHHAATLAATGHDHLQHAQLMDYRPTPSASTSPSPHETASASPSPSPSATPDHSPTPNHSPSPTPSPDASASPHSTSSPSPSASPAHSPNHQPAGSNPNVTPGTTTPGPVKVYDAEHMSHVHQEYAGSKPGVLPNANHMLHFEPDKHGSGMTVRLEGMQEGGTTINGHDITHAQLTELHAAITVNVNGHPKTIYVPMNGHSLHLPPEVAKFVEHYKFDSFKVVVPGKTPNHWTVISTVLGNDHNYSTAHLDKIVSGYDTHLQNHGGQPAAGAEVVGSSSDANLHTTLTGGHSMTVINSGHTLQVDLAKNVLTPNGQHFFNIPTPSGVTFDHNHWQVDHAAQLHINEALREHGLYAVYHNDSSGNVNAIHIHSLKAGDKMDLQLPKGYEAALSPNHKTMFITLPDGKGTVKVKLPAGAFDAKTGALNFDDTQPAIKAAFLRQQHLAVVFHDHSATVAATPRSTASPSTVSAGASVEKGTNADWAIPLVLGAGVIAATATTSSVREKGYLRMHAVNPVIDAFREHREAPARERARTNAFQTGRDALLNPGPDNVLAVSELLQAMRSPDLRAEFEPGSTSHDHSGVVVADYADLILDHANLPDDADFVDTATRHIAALGIGMGSARFIVDKGGYLDIESDEDGGASIKAIAGQLSERFGKLPEPDAFLNNDRTRQSIEALRGQGGQLAQYGSVLDAVAASGGDDPDAELPEKQLGHVAQATVVRGHIMSRIDDVLRNLANNSPGRESEVLEALGLNDLVRFSDDDKRYVYDDAPGVVVQLANRLVNFAPAPAPTPAPVA